MPTDGLYASNSVKIGAFTLGPIQPAVQNKMQTIHDKVLKDVLNEQVNMFVIVRYPFVFHAQIGCSLPSAPPPCPTARNGIRMDA